MTTPTPDALTETRDQVRDELRRADTKATTLLSLVAATLAGVVALSGRHLPPPASVALWLSAVPFAACILTLLSVIRPRFGGRNPVPGSWLHAAQTDPTTLLRTYRTDGSPRTAEEVCRMAAIAKTKYQRIGHAVSLLVIGLAGLAVTVLLTVVTR